MSTFLDVIPAPDTRANQPAANAVPKWSLYSVSDEGNIVEQSNGVAWVLWAGGGGSGGEILADGSVPMAADLDLGGFKITDLDDGTANDHAVNKGQLDAAIAAAVAALLGSKAGAANVTTTEGQSAGAGYGDLATAGPSVTLTTGASAIVLVCCNCDKSTTGNTGWMSFAVSGATTIAAADSRGASQSSSLATGTNSIVMISLVTGLTPGSNTFTAKYRNDGGSWTFRNRAIAVLAL